MYNLSGKVAVVTGAAGAGGLGRAIALRLAQEGADVAVNDLPEDRGRRGSLVDTVAAIEAVGREAWPIYADVTDAEQVDAMVAEAYDHFGRLDILVNNAGAPAGADRVLVVDMDEAAFDLVQAVNVKGTFLCSRAFARALVAQGQGGRIINMSSQSGKQGVARFAAYCASKFAVIGFTQSLALELGPQLITVNAICPGLVATERIDDMAAALAPEGVTQFHHRHAMIERSITQTAIGRMVTAEDVANTAAYLASAQSSSLTGLAVSVTAGASLA